MNGLLSSDRCLPLQSMYMGFAQDGDVNYGRVNFDCGTIGTEQSFLMQPIMWEKQAQHHLGMEVSPWDFISRLNTIALSFRHHFIPAACPLPDPPPALAAAEEQ